MKANPKPTIGRLLYNGKQVGEMDTFRNLTAEKIRLIQKGFDKRFFKLTY